VAQPPQTRQERDAKGCVLQDAEADAGIQAYRWTQSVVRPDRLRLELA
jgi:hypothetical protein